MADYYPLIARAVAGLPQNTDAARHALYERARNGLVTHLRGQTPTLSESDITRERLLLEEAIRKVETEAIAGTKKRSFWKNLIGQKQQDPDRLSKNDVIVPANSQPQARAYESFSMDQPATVLAFAILDEKIEIAEAAMKELGTNMHRNAAVPVAMKRFHTKVAPATRDRSERLDPLSRDLARVCDVLVAVGTNEAVLALVEIFRSVKPQAISSYGYLDHKDEGDDGKPAARIAKIPNGLAMAKAACTLAEFERILVLASAWGDIPDLIPELEALATPHTIVWLTKYLQRRGRTQKHLDDVKAAKAALVRLGKKSHPKLLMELGRAACAEPEVQSLFWTNILDVLGRTGDAACLAPIQKLEQLVLSPPVPSACEEAIKQISVRLGSVPAQRKSSAILAPKLACQDDLRAAMQSNFPSPLKIDIMCKFHSKRQFSVCLKYYFACVACLESLRDKYLVAGLHDGTFNDLMIVTAFDQGTEHEWERQFRMGNLGAIERSVLTEEEIEIRRAGVPTYSNYTLPNCVLTPEGTKIFNSRFNKVLSPDYAAIESLESLL